MTAKEMIAPFDPFELAAALLLGLGAVSTAVASYQAGLWGGASVEGYGESASMTTEAGSTYNDELASFIQDTQVDGRAKELIWEAGDIDDPARSRRLFEIAGFLYTSRLSDPAYQGLGLPEPVEGADGQPESLSEEALEKSLQVDLRDEYLKALFAPSTGQFEEAKARFGKAREANEIGDQFSLAGVILTISLFFGGLALVFKTRVKWGFLGSGAVVFAVGLIYMLTLTWA